MNMRYIATAMALASLGCGSCAGVARHDGSAAKRETMTGRIYYMIQVEPEAMSDPVQHAMIRLDHGGDAFVSIRRKSEVTIETYTLSDGDRIQFSADPEQVGAAMSSPMRMRDLKDLTLLEVAPKKPAPVPEPRATKAGPKRDGAKGPWAPPPGFPQPAATQR